MMNNPIIKTKHATIYAASNLDVLPTLADNSVDSIVCDPPYELGFMGKAWDATGIAYSVELWRECLRVLKPGGHLLAFGGTRTWHRLAVAIEDAGFEIRDSIAWLYGSGFPKSHNISKAIDKLYGAEREVIGTKIASPKGISQAESRTDSAAGSYGGESKEIDITAPATDDAQKWDGWGTALKPAHEPIVVARKPLTGTVAENVLQYGVGGINVDATRIGTSDNLNGGAYAKSGTERTDGWGMQRASAGEYEQPEGRWPANIILDETTAELLDEQSGDRKGMATQKSSALKIYGGNSLNESKTTFPEIRQGFNDSGGASRFFYVAKASKRDRNEGLNELPIRRPDLRSSTGMGTFEEKGVQPQHNFHPTVKPTLLMQYLIRLVTPENGIVLDPFCGSGSTGKAAILENKTFIGIEITEDYLDIIRGRIEHAEQTLLDRAGDLFE